MYHYTDFDDLFYYFNRYHLKKPEKFQGQRGCRFYSNGVHIRIDKPITNDIDIAKLGYTKNKWSHLLRHYVVKEKLLDFYELANNETGFALTYDFLDKHDKHTTKSGNSGCMRQFTLSRDNPSRGKTWTQAHVFWRATEIAQKLPVDLIMLDHIFAGGLNFDIQEVNFYFCNMWVATNRLAGIYQVFDLNVPDYISDSYLIRHPYFRELKKDYDRYYRAGNELQKYKTIAKIQQLHWEYLEGQERAQLKKEQLLNYIRLHDK